MAGDAEALDGIDASEAGVDLRIPAGATADEAAAIAAAIDAYLAEERAAIEDEWPSPWTGRRWSFAGRLGQLTGRAGRAPEDAPSDGWTAAGRADRF